MTEKKQTVASLLENKPQQQGSGSGFTDEKPLVIGITGASGAIYARRTAQLAREAGVPVELVVSKPGMQVIRYEKESDLLDDSYKIHDIDNFFAAPASGTANYRGMVVVPCSMGTLGKIATASGDNLLTRAADVMLKERRPLILVPREAPMNLIHLENQVSAARAGAIIIPASPHFYQHPLTIEDLVDTVVARILDQLKIPHHIGQPWGQK